MRLKPGGITGPEKVFAERFAATGDRQYAASEAGYKFPTQAAAKALSRPNVHSEILRIQTETLFSTILPLAIKTHEKMLRDDATPAGARAQLIKLAYDRTIGVGDQAGAKEPHEMTAEELDSTIAKLRGAAADRARVVLELEPNAGVFD